ncbi:holo-[acyl-carrier protein] synthase [Alkalibacillus flavidus]|uniref:Holo-[acyl-carrier-protein] synthase n=1 Tax=Alkalibacillus flavidus TaxID=546021 RepID=A0ABV2KZF0_9BACI
MIQGIGVDIQEIDRIQTLLSRQPRFTERILTTRERQVLSHYTNEKRRLEFIAGRFAAKEAYSKALGCGIGRDVSFHSIEIISNEAGRPSIYVEGTLEPHVHVSISHSNHYVVAQVIIEIVS